VTWHFDKKYPLHGICKVIHVLERRQSNVPTVMKSLDTKAISEDIVAHNIHHKA